MAGWHDRSPTKAFSISATMRLEYRMIGPRPDAAPTLVLLHEGLGSVGVWGSFPDELAAATGAGVFAYSRAGYGQLVAVEAAAPGLLHARRGARGAAARARRDRLPPRSAGRPQRRRIDRRDLRRQRPGSSRARARADGAALLHRGHGHRRDRARQGGVRGRAICAPSSRGCTPISTTRSTTGAVPGSIPSSASGTSPTRSPISACRS